MEHPIVSERAPSRLCARYGVEASVFLPAVCVCVFFKLHITAQSDPVIVVILCHSHMCECVCVCVCVYLLNCT